MTVIASCGSSALASAGVAEEETHTPHRNVRVPDERWEPFGFTAGKRGRSIWLNEFMDWVNAHPDIWKLARERHADDLGEVLAQLLAWYEREPGARLPRRPSA